MDKAEHDYLLYSDFVDHSKRIDEKLTDAGLTSLWHDPAAFTHRGQRRCSLEDLVKERGCRLRSTFGDVGNGCVKLQTRSATPDYSAAPRTHFRRNS